MAKGNVEIKDYSLIGSEGERAAAAGLAEAGWYLSLVPKETMRELLVRKDWPALRDTVIWFALIFFTGWISSLLFAADAWFGIVPYLIYCIVFGASASRWHEAGHGTAFKTDWMNRVLYEISSFMACMPSTPWRWSHVRHHSDTIIVGRDPEIAFPRPPSIRHFLLDIIALRANASEYKRLFLHAAGVMDPVSAVYIPKSEHHKSFLKARVYLLIYFAVIAASFYYRSLLPIVFIIVPSFIGRVTNVFFASTQHMGLAENVLDHRLNCRTVYMNPIFRFLYWEMNYHVEHHMFPLVPYHALKRLHECIRNDCPPAYPSIWAAYREMIPTFFKQRKDPSYYIKREVPAAANAEVQGSKCFAASESEILDGWIEVCPAAAIGIEEAVRFDCNQKTFVLCRSAAGKLYAADGMCTHGNSHLADGFVQGDTIECAKHHGRFDFRNGSPKRPPACKRLQVYPVSEREGKVFLDIKSASQKFTRAD